MKILVGCNLLTSVQSMAYIPHMSFWYRLGKNHPDWDIVAYTPRRASIDGMRNTAAQFALEQECDYLFFYDDDVILPYGVLESLLETGADIAAGVTMIRSYPFKPMAFKYEDTKDGGKQLVDYLDYADHVDDNGIVECGAIGFSCVLIKVALLKEIPKPYFVTGSRNTEDVYFCVRAKEHKPTVKIIMDTKVPTMHLLDQYAISPENVEEFCMLEKSLFDMTSDSQHDRGMEYRTQCLEQLRRMNASQ